MQSGLLTGSFTEARAAALGKDDWRARAPEFQSPRLQSNLALAEALRPIATRHGATVGAIAVAWTLAAPGVTGAIVGARSPAQVDGWIAAGRIELTPDDVSEIASAIGRTGAGTGPASAQADRHLVARASLQVVAFSGLLAWLIPLIAIEGSGTAWIDPARTIGLVVILSAQCLAVPGILGLSAVQEFVTRGRGTPVPFDPPRHIVTTGVYVYVANPMQLSAVICLLLLAVIVGNVWVAAAALIAHVYSVGLAGWDEDEDLRARFGADWPLYKQRVRKWIFGEYVPLQRLLFFIGPIVEAASAFLPGQEAVILPVDGHRASTAICYEVIFASLMRQFVLNGSELLTTITNDAWYGTSSAPYQHWEQASMRAIENGRYLARAANTGISGFVDPYGRVMQRSALFEQALLVGDLRFIRERTIYSRIGDLVAWASLAFTIAALVVAFRLRIQ